MTRTYRLGKRAEQQAETRARILEAAKRLYRERGMAGTSMLAVATAADVAPGTVRNHFPDTESLAVAVGEAVLDELGLPDDGIYRGTRSVGVRLERLAAELAYLSDRGEVWWAVMQREPELARVWSTLETSYAALLDRHVRAALGPLAGDDEAVAVVSATIGPPLFYALKQSGHSSDDAVRIGLELLLPWVERRARLARAGART